MARKEWTISDISNGKALKPLEFKDRSGEWHDFDVVETPERLVFGSLCNGGLLESGYLLKEPDENSELALIDLFADLEKFYNDGSEYTSRIVFNDRM